MSGTRLEPKSVDWSKGDGLVPAIVQHAHTLQVLMVGYMSREALERSQASGFVTFHSRSKGRLWQKGETSGNRLELVSVTADCDADALLVRARPEGPACHRGTASCFGDEEAPGLGFLAKLTEIVAERAAVDPAESYTARLLAGGSAAAAKKVGEEGVEVALSAALGDGRLGEETADLLYHLVVLLHASGTDLGAAAEILRRRHLARPSLEGPGAAGSS